jgi:type I restriction enzyme S subunit
MAASGSLGRTHYIKGKFISSDLCFILTPKKGLRLDLTFYHRLFNFLRTDIVKKTATGTSKLAINRTNFGVYKLPYFDYDHQLFFRDKMEKINNICESFSLELNDQLGFIEKLRQQILQEAIEGKLTAKWRRKNPKLISGDKHASKLLEKIKAEKERLVKEKKIKKQKPLAPITDNEKPFDLPEGWLWCRLGDWGITQTGTTPSTLVSSNFGSHIPFIKPADISLKGIAYKNEGLSENGLNKGRLICRNSVLMVCIGGSIGKSFFTDRDVSCNQQINSITPLAQASARLLQQLLQSKYFQVEIWNKAMKSSTPIVNKGKWEEILIPIPPFAEQGIILNRLDEFMAMIDELEMQGAERKEQSEMLMQSVLQEAFEVKA